MCKKKNCERHEFNNGLCLPHLKESLGLGKPKRNRKKKVDAVEVDTTDNTTEMETREAE